VLGDFARDRKDTPDPFGESHARCFLATTKFNGNVRPRTK
jgi:hypothetical protein